MSGYDWAGIAENAYVQAIIIPSVLVSSAAASRINCHGPVTVRVALENADSRSNRDRSEESCQPFTPSPTPVFTPTPTPTATTVASTTETCSLSMCQTVMQATLGTCTPSPCTASQCCVYMDIGGIGGSLVGNLHLSGITQLDPTTPVITVSGCVTVEGTLDLSQVS